MWCFGFVLFVVVVVWFGGGRWCVVWFVCLWVMYDVVYLFVVVVGWCNGVEVNEVLVYVWIGCSIGCVVEDCKVGDYCWFRFYCWFFDWKCGDVC